MLNKEQDMREAEVQSRHTDWEDNDDVRSSTSPVLTQRQTPRRHGNFEGEKEDESKRQT